MFEVKPKFNVEKFLATPITQFWNFIDKERDGGWTSGTGATKCIQLIIPKRETKFTKVSPIFPIV